MLRLDWNLLFTVINLLLLFVLMKIFLFKPVQKIIAARQAEADKQFDEAAAKQAEADGLKAQYAKSIASVEEEKSKAMQETMKKADAEYQRIVGDAESKAKQIKEDAAVEAENQKTQILKKAEKEIADMVVKSAEKLLVVGSTPESDKALYDTYLDTASKDITVSGVSKEAKSTLSSRLARISEKTAENGGSEQDVADVVGEAALAAIERGRTAESDGAVYDEFLKSVSEGSANGK